MLRCHRVSCLPHNLFRGNIAPTPPWSPGAGVAGVGPPYGPSTRQDTRVVSVAAPASNQLLLLIILFSELHYLSPTGHCTGWAAHVPCPSSDIRHISSVEICGSLQSTASTGTSTSTGTSSSTSPPTLLTATIYEKLGTAGAAACGGVKFICPPERR